MYLIFVWKIGLLEDFDNMELDRFYRKQKINLRYAVFLFPEFRFFFRSVSLLKSALFSRFTEKKWVHRFNFF